jgi:DNA (cytosine-5)-methyltransferase 1
MTAVDSSQTTTTVESSDYPASTSFEFNGSELIRTLRIGDLEAKSAVTVKDRSGDDLGDWWLQYLQGQSPQSLSPISRELRFAELFCGSGGLALGAAQACAELGIQSRSVAAVDHDPKAVGVYAANHYPNITSTESVSVLVDYRVKGSAESAKFRYEPELLEPAWSDLVGQIDVLFAGPPCQGHSNLNNHSRRDDLRNELYLTVPAMAIALQAPIVVIENVPAVIHDRTGVVATTMNLLQREGYAVETGVLKADAMGWAQRRSRFFVIASRLGSPLPIKAVADLLADTPRSVEWVTSAASAVPPDHHMLRKPELSQENLHRINWLFDNAAYNLPLSERPECHRDGTTYMSVYGRLKPTEPAPTITTGFMTPGRGRFIHPNERRTLTPLEAARIQGFPDTYDFSDPSGGAPTSQKLAKWIGDAVPMPLGYAATLAALATSADSNYLGRAIRQS